MFSRPKRCAFKFERLNPADKLQQMFSPAALSTILKSLLPFAAIAWIGCRDAFASHWAEILGSSYADARHFASLVSGILLRDLLEVRPGSAALGGRGLPAAVVEERRRSEDEPAGAEGRDEADRTATRQNKARIRRLQRQSRRKQMLKAAETATVVITNPTHYAVALRYEAEHGRADRGGQGP